MRTPPTVGTEPGTQLPHPSQSLDPSERVGLGTLWAYSLPSVALGFTGLLFAMYLMKFATDVLLIAPAAMGTLMMISRIWDGISDPMAGFLSDRTRSRFGRRRSWMFIAAVPMGATFAMMWSPPAFLDGFGLVLWMGFTLLLYETASTAYFVPHGALGVELTRDYHERTRLFGYRHMISFIGLGLGLLGYSVITGAEDERAMASRLTMIGGAVLSVVIVGTTLRLPERPEYQGRATAPLLESLADVVRNPHARLLLLVYGIETFGTASIVMLVPYLTEYVIDIEGAGLSGTGLSSAVVIIGAYFVPQVALTPLWIRLSRRFGKRDLWLAAMITTCLAFCCFFFVDEDSSWAFYVLPVVLGSAAGCGAVLAPSIKADVIDYDELMTGQRKEGSYLAVWNFIRKAAAGLAMGITGYALSIAGFVPGQAQPEAVLLTLRSLFSWFPAGCYVVGISLALRFSLDEAAHAEVRRRLEARRGHDPAAGLDPGTSTRSRGA